MNSISEDFFIAQIASLKESISELKDKVWEMQRNVDEIQTYINGRAELENEQDSI